MYVNANVSYIKVVRLLAYLAIDFFIVFSFTSILHFKAHAVTHELTSAGEARQFSYFRSAVHDQYGKYIPPLMVKDQRIKHI